ncbi:hypothetical protein D3C75_1070640 [compost metagenome]
MDLLPYVAGRLLNLGEGLTGFECQSQPLLHICRHLMPHHIVDARDQADHLGNGFLDLSRAYLGSFGQLAHFSGHNGKSPAMLPGPCGFNSRIQRQQIGLLGDGRNGRAGLRNLGAKPVQLGDQAAGVLY